MRHNFDLYRRLLSVQLRSQLQYRFSFLLEMFSTAFVVLLEFASIALVFERFGHIKGWSLGEVAFLYGLVETSFGLMDMVFSGFDPQRFGQSVRRGSFDQLLLRPINITAQVMGSDFALRRLGKIALGTGILFYAVTLNPISWTLGKVLYLPLVIASNVLFFGGLFVVGSTITFWTVESIEVINILTYGGSFVISYPMHIYQRWMRHFFTYIVPAIFLTYFPSLYFLDKPDPLHFPGFAPFLTPAAGLLVWAASMVFWHFGLKHYQSTGT